MLRVRTSGHAAKDCKFNQAKGQAQGKGKAKNASLTRTLQPSLKASQERSQLGRLSEAKDKKVHSVGETPSTANGGGIGRNRSDR